MQATKNKQRCKQDCNEHIFYIKNKNGNSKLDVHINFCPKFRRDPHPPQKTIPQYNFDKRYYTQAFVIGTQLKTVSKKTQQQQMHFQTMVKDACQKNNQVFFPRPNQKNSYCSVCKEHFKIYYEHINTQSHRIKIDAAIYNTQIKRLCNFYQSKWSGAQQQADRIIAELVRQNQLYKQGLNKEIQQNQEQQQEQDQDKREGSQQLDQQNEQNQEEDQEQIQQDLQQNEEKSSQQNNLEDNKQREQSNQQIKNNNKTNNDQYKQTIERQIKYQYSQQSKKAPTKQKNTFCEIKNVKVNLNFFQTNNKEFVIFLQKNKNGKYQVVKQIQEVKLSIENQIAKQQKQQKQQRDAKSRVKQQKIMSKEEKKKMKQLPKFMKQNRQIFRIKYPQLDKSKQSFDNQSSFQYNSKDHLCKILKQRILKNKIKIKTQNQIKIKTQKQIKIKTQKQIKKQNSQNRQYCLKKQNIKDDQKNESIYQRIENKSQNYDSKYQEKNQIKKQVVKQNNDFQDNKYYRDYKDHKDNRDNKEYKDYKQKKFQKDQKSILPPSSQQKYILATNHSHIYGHQGQVYPNYDNRNMQMNGYGTRNLPNQPTIHSNAVYMNPGIQIHLQNQKIPPTRPNINGPNNYMSMPPTHMMKQPIYYNNMMPCNMLLRNEGTLIQQDKNKERQNYTPIYHPQNSWNPYMMNSHPIMRPPEGIPEQLGGMPRQHIQNPYMYHSSPPPPHKNIQKNGQNINTSVLPSNMSIYIPSYQMDSRYQPYMGYDYMVKKPQQRDNK